MAPPYANPEDRRRYEQQRAAERAAQGLCRNCNEKARPGKSRCQECQDKVDENTRQRRKSSSVHRP